MTMVPGLMVHLVRIAGEENSMYKTCTFCNIVAQTAPTTIGRRSKTGLHKIGRFRSHSHRDKHLNNHQVSLSPQLTLNHGELCV